MGGVLIWGLAIYVLSSVVIGRLVKTARASGGGEGPRSGATWFPFLREWAVAYYDSPRYNFVLISLFVPFLWPFLPITMAFSFAAIARDEEKPVHAFLGWLMYTAMFTWTVWALITIVLGIWASMTAN